MVNVRPARRGDRESSVFVETPTPSLVGHMGGPISGADGCGVVWENQSHTMRHALGFPLPASDAGRRDRSSTSSSTTRARGKAITAFSYVYD